MAKHVRLITWPFLQDIIYEKLNEIANRIHEDGLFHSSFNQRMSFYP